MLFRKKIRVDEVGCSMSTEDGSVLAVWVCVGLSVWCLVLWGLEQEKKIKNKKKLKKK